MGALDKIHALAAKAVADGVDMTKAQTGGGGDYTPPAAGPTRIRFVAYIEVGKQKATYQGRPKTEDTVILVFELSGPKHPPTVTESGEKIPHRITIKLNKSLNEKAKFFKLFQVMNYQGKATHMAQLLGEAFKATVVHREWSKGDKKGVEAELYDKVKGAFTIEPPRYEVVQDGEPTGEFAVLKVDPAITPIKCFLWAHADMEQWADIFIDGEYPERKDEKTGAVIAPAKSKNRFQNLIKTAVNFEGSPIHQLLVAGGATIDIPDAEQVRDDVPGEGDDEVPAAPPPKSAAEAAPTGQAATDALAGIVG